jgi:hypothetical protein
MIIWPRRFIMGFYRYVMQLFTLCEQYIVQKTDALIGLVEYIYVRLTRITGDLLFISRN